MKALLQSLLVVLAFAAGGAEPTRPPLATEDFSIGFLPLDWVKTALGRTMSPRGRSSLISATGPLRISDAPENLQAVRQTLAELQQAPALLTLDLTFATTSHRTVQRPPVEAPAMHDGIPVPSRYDPPRLLTGPNGSFTVIPAQPRGFTTRNVGPGAVVNPGLSGYGTLSPEVRVSETKPITSVMRHFSLPCTLGKEFTIPIQKNAGDIAALRALAQRYGAVGNAEPAWTTASDELAVNAALIGGIMVVNITPEVVLPPAAPGAQARKVSLKACAAGVTIARGAPSSTGALPKTDPEFYRVFFGAAQAGDDTFTALTVAAQLQYLGNAPKQAN